MQKIKNVEESILSYTNAWNETEREVIKENISRCRAPEATYTDRLTGTITGQDAITDLIISSYEKKGPRSFKVLSQAETHHSNGCLRWLAIGPQGLPGYRYGLF